LYKIGDTLKLIITEQGSINYRINQRYNERRQSSGEGGTGDIVNFIPRLSLGENHRFQTGNQIRYTGNFTKILSVVVTNIDSTGLLNIKGELNYQLNNVQEQILIQAKVNPSDIKNKTIYSSDLISPVIYYSVKDIKPAAITPADYIQSISTNITVTATGTYQTNITITYKISDTKQKSLIIKYLNRILSIITK